MLNGLLRSDRVVVRRQIVAAALTAGVLVAGCIGGTAPATQPAICDGVPADMGGCAPDRPKYTGATCSDLAEQWGGEIDQRVTALIDEPEIVNGKAKSARLRDVFVLTSTLLSQHMASKGLLAECDVPEFLPRAEEQFSRQLRDGAGALLYDADPMASYDEWLAELKKWIAVIDTDDPTPSGPSG